MKTNVAIAILIVAIVAIAGGGYYFWTVTQAPQSVKIQQKGSDTMLILA